MKINKIILGTVQFGLNYGINNTSGKPSGIEVFSMLDYAAENGIRILDTADAYGNATEVLGTYLKSHPGRFDINTKFRYDQSPVSVQLKESLKALNVNYIDTYFYHRFEDFRNFPELLEELNDLKTNNFIRKTGLSVYENSEFEAAILHPEIDVIQFPFNLLDNLNHRGTLMKLAREKGKELQVRSVFLQGLFFKDPGNLPAMLQPLRKSLETIHVTAEKFNLSVTNLALRYALQQPEINNVIIGVDNAGQLRRNIETISNPLSDEIINIINQINVQNSELLYPKNWN